MATFHSDFWVAVVAAAPVIALAALLTSGDAIDAKVSLSRRRRLLGARPPTHPDDAELLLRRGGRTNLRSYLASSVNTIIQGLVFMCGLVSLSDQRDAVPRILVVAGQTVGFFLLIDATTAAARTRHMAFHLDEAQSEPGPKDEAAQPSS